MPFDLEVNFEYLCAFVPPVPFDQSPTECWAVLPDFTELLDPAHRHFPCVLYERDHRVGDPELEQGGLIPRPASTEVAAGSNRRLIVCEGEEIEIRPDGQTPTTSNLSLDGALPHLLRIARAALGMEIFDRKLLEDPSPSRVAARMRLRAGELSERAVTPEEFRLLEHQTGQEVHRQRMARSVTLKIEAVGFVDLVFRKLSDPPGEERLLRLRTEDTTSTVTVRNCEEQFIWKNALPGYDEQSDSEMNLYFPLSVNYDVTSPLSRMVLKMSLDPNAPNGICAPKTFDGAG